MVPTETRVSMVAAPWRRFTQAARWNGQAAHTITGAASTSDSHCQYGNCRAGIIAIRMTGTDSTTEPASRCRRDRSSPSSARSAAGACSVLAGAGSSAV